MSTTRSILFNVEPMAKPRMTQRDKWMSPPRPPVEKYRNFETAIGLIANSKNFTLPAAFSVKFIFSTPQKNRWGMPHKNKPDLDNCIKAILDCLRPDDSDIHTIHARKVWGETGHIVITELE